MFTATPIQSSLSNQSVQNDVTPSLNSTNFQLFMPPPPKYGENQSIYRPGNQSNIMTSLPEQQILANVNQSNFHQTEAKYGNQSSEKSLFIPQQMQQMRILNLDNIPYMRNMPQSIDPPFRILNSFSLNMENPQGPGNLAQQMSLDPSQVFQLVTDQGVFNIQSIVPVPMHNHPIPNVVNGPPVPQTVSHFSVDSNVAGNQLLLNQPMALENMENGSTNKDNGTCLYRPVPVYNSSTGLTQIVYVPDMTDHQSGGSPLGNIPLVVSVGGNPLSVPNIDGRNVLERVDARSFHQNQELATVTSQTASSVANTPSQICVSYETQSQETGEPIIQQFILPPGDQSGVVTLPIITPGNKPVQQKETGVAMTTNDVSINQSYSVKVSQRSKGKNEPQLLVQGSPLTQENLQGHLKTIDGKLQSVKQHKHDPTKPRVKSRHVSGASRSRNESGRSRSRNESGLGSRSRNESGTSRSRNISGTDRSRNISGLSNASKTSLIMAHVTKKLHSLQEHMFESGHRLVPRSRSRQVSGNSEAAGDRSRKSSGNSLLSENSSLPFSNLSSPNIFLDKEKGVFFIQSLDGLEMCEIGASPSFEEMIRGTEVIDQRSGHSGQGQDDTGCHEKPV